MGVYMSYTSEALVLTATDLRIPLEPRTQVLFFEGQDPVLKECDAAPFYCIEVRGLPPAPAAQRISHQEHLIFTKLGLVSKPYTLFMGEEKGTPEARAACLALALGVWRVGPEGGLVQVQDSAPEADVAEPFRQAFRKLPKGAIRETR